MVKNDSRESGLIQDHYTWDYAADPACIHIKQGRGTFKVFSQRTVFIKGESTIKQRM